MAEMKQDMLFPETPQDKLHRMISCISREIGYRERVYPRWVSAGKMTATQADYELSTMKDVLMWLQGGLTNG